MAGREITGKHVFIGFTLFFAVIVGVNAFMAISAVRTFPGLEAKNGYVTSQSFDARESAQLALGWQLQAEVTDEKVLLAFTGPDGAPVRPARIEASIGRPTESADDIAPDFTYAGGRFEAPMRLGPGKWILRLKAHAADGTLFQQRRALIANRE